MAKKTVYRKVVDIDVGEDVVILPDNRTLLIEQLTDKAPKQPEIKDFRKIDEVFEHFQPETEITFENENGVPQKETLKFNNLNDFGPDGIAKQSEFLKGIKNKKEVYEKFIEIIKKNSTLRNALSDPKAKEQVLKGLHAMLIELDKSIK